MPIENLTDNITDYITAAAGLGTAAYALVDGSKAFRGGVSNHGFEHIERVLKKFYPELDGKNSPQLQNVLGTLKANWINGKPLADQQAIAKTLIKLQLDKINAPTLAEATGVDAEKLTSVAEKIASGNSLQQDEQDVFGRFDLMLSAMLDEGYQRADQVYRNSAKAWSIGVSILLALFGAWVLKGAALDVNEIGAALLVGFAATPVAPVAKDLTSAISAAVKAAQLWRK